MRGFLAAGTAIAIVIWSVAADNCAGKSFQDAGNYYCSAVKGITYTDVGGSGSYDQVTNMDDGTGICSSTPKDYSGNIAPLDEEVGLLPLASRWAHLMSCLRSPYTLPGPSC